MRWRKPDFEQMEQLQSPHSSVSGASTSKRTAPQWHPPSCITLALAGTGRLECNGILKRDVAVFYPGRNYDGVARLHDEFLIATDRP